MRLDRASCEGGRRGAAPQARGLAVRRRQVRRDAADPTPRCTPPGVAAGTAPLTRDFSHLGPCALCGLLSPRRAGETPQARHLVAHRPALPRAPSRLARDFSRLGPCALCGLLSPRRTGATPQARYLAMRRRALPRASPRLLGTFRAWNRASCEGGRRGAAPQARGLAVRRRQVRRDAADPTPRCTPPGVAASAAPLTRRLSCAALSCVPGARRTAHRASRRILASAPR